MLDSLEEFVYYVVMKLVRIGFGCHCYGDGDCGDGDGDDVLYENISYDNT